MDKTSTSEQLNEKYTRKIPVLPKEIDDRKSEEFIMYKATRVPQKV